MNKELLALLVPKTQSLEKSSGSNDSITPEDINIILSYSHLSKEEYLFLLMKFVSADSYKESFLKQIKEDCELEDEEILDKIINLAIIECCEPRCIFCGGTGTTVAVNTAVKCPHCTDGVFSFTDEVRGSLLGMKHIVYKKHEDFFMRVKERIENIEISSLSKIGDT
tara:strand:- start:1100 stop:1600 length:501 start_codon:yes stop_codon:yes gene_type:complete